MNIDLISWHLSPPIYCYVVHFLYGQKNKKKCKPTLYILTYIVPYNNKPACRQRYAFLSRWHCLKFFSVWYLSLHGTAHRPTPHWLHLNFVWWWPLERVRSEHTTQSGHSSALFSQWRSISLSGISLPSTEGLHPFIFSFLEKYSSSAAMTSCTETFRVLCGAAVHCQYIWTCYCWEWHWSFSYTIYWNCVGKGMSSFSDPLHLPLPLMHRTDPHTQDCLCLCSPMSLCLALIRFWTHTSMDCWKHSETLCVMPFTRQNFAIPHVHRVIPFVQGQHGRSQSLWHTTPLTTDSPKETSILAGQLSCYCWWGVIIVCLHFMAFSFVGCH